MSSTQTKACANLVPPASLFKNISASCLYKRSRFARLRRIRKCQINVASSGPRLPNSTKARALACLCFILRLSCFLKIAPYNWDQKRRRLRTLRGVGLLRFYMMSCIPPASCMFMVFRYLQVQARKLEMPPRIRVMNLIWALAYAYIFVVKFQVIVRTRQVMSFANALLAEQEKLLEMENDQGRDHDLSLEMVEQGKNGKIERVINKNKNTPLKKKGKAWDWISITVIVGTFLLIVNPPLHSVVLLDTPCAPQYISSLVLPCKWMGDNPVAIYELIPFLLWECFAVTDMLTSAAWPWAVIILGLNWIKREMLKYGKNDITTFLNTVEFEDGRTKRHADYMGIVAEYRRVQIMTRFVNDAFYAYLTVMPWILYTTAGTMLFAAIRFTHLPLHIFLLYPACGIRCIFEVTSQLEAAANMSQESEKYLMQARSRFRDAITMNENALAKYLTKLRRSCPKLTCSSGSLYTFEKTIVLVSLSNCTQLIFNLLVAFPTAQEGNWGQKLVQSNVTSQL